MNLEPWKESAYALVIKVYYISSGNITSGNPALLPNKQINLFVNLLIKPRSKQRMMIINFLFNRRDNSSHFIMSKTVCNNFSLHSAK